MVGGKLADIFGLSDARYQYVMDEYLEQQENVKKKIFAMHTN